ncbi:MAG: 2-amino-4-hydroxy-6-hydroxymethyldihydropteridine diphosphokinase [candidate division WOR-3 bacterium]|uniref:2-amino-4-hydroxy-6-hydroxymethyldihydropteridine diphosphokinase n=1 Tax=candidate division WOR-3 bacterium TaxID=2052148 RepID=A0A7C2B8T8_UNCW3|nr:2-amino-4-hydroxy-6-hydroxymethyldihydropteridine diphosphokinase [candidate division WOR-3 bacterium]
MVTEVYLGVGSNLGDRDENLYRALAELVKLGPLQRSSWYETEPAGMAAGTPHFLNGAVRLWTEVSLEALHARIIEIETRLGREPVRSSEEPKRSRIIDIDILFFNHRVIGWQADKPVSGAKLIVPHPHLHKRAFVLVPLAELAPDFRHPVLGLTVRELLANVDTSEVRPWERS